MKQAIKPGFFVVGAPKSGTTSLYFYLKKHPQVYLPRIKELNFFCTDLHFRFPLLNEQQFLSYYQECKNEKAIGEVAVWNLYSVDAAQNIHQFNPASKIIILLRNPAEMMHALHSNHVFNDNEIITDFEMALNAQPDRKKGLRISPDIKCPVEGLYYYDVAAYSVQVKRFLDLFGTERVKVILFDDFVTHTKEIYQELLKFLEVEEIVPGEFEVFNASKTTRSALLKKITVHTPGWIRRTGQWLFPHQTARRDWLMFWLWKINTKEVKRPPLDPALRMKIASTMKAEIDVLEILLGRNLSRWR
ncbi:MAG: sulfotransferase domain-containing protein [Chitinophagales bacterium]